MQTQPPSRFPQEDRIIPKLTLPELSEKLHDFAIEDAHLVEEIARNPRVRSWDGDEAGGDYGEIIIPGSTGLSAAAVTRP